jgi:hypothetical protein
MRAGIFPCPFFIRFSNRWNFLPRDALSDSTEASVLSSGSEPPAAGNGPVNF